MKLVKTLALGSLALALASVASATTYIKITGSTAFRKANIFAICNSLNSPKAAFAGTTGTSSTDISGQARVVIRGTLKSGPSAGQDVVYQLALAGSVGGVAAIDSDTGAIPGAAFGSTKTWLKDDLSGNTLTAVTVNAGSITGATFISDAATTPFEAWAQPNAAFSDSLAGSTPTTSNPDVTEVSPGAVGVIDFYWCKGPKHADILQADYDKLANITQQQAAALQKNGILPLSQFTGNSADSGIDVIVVGRNSDSGTRLAAEAEAQLGFQLITPTLYRVNTTTANVTGDWTGFTEQGYDSGGKVATDLRFAAATGKRDDNSKPYILVGYIGKSDKNSVIAAAGGGQFPGVVLAYNGVAASDAAINNGAYTFWTYQHTYHRYTGTSVAVNALELQAARVISTDFVQSGLSIASMGFFSRAFEGAPVQQ